MKAAALLTLYCASAISILYTDYKDERMSRMTTGRVGAWGFVSESAALFRLLSDTWLKMWLWHLQKAMGGPEINH